MHRLKTPLDAPLGLFFISALGGLWAAYDRRLSWPMLVVILLGIICYYVIINIGTSENRLWGLALVGLLGSLVVAVYFVSQGGYLGYAPKLQAVSRLHQALSRVFPRFTPFHPHRNSVAAFLEGWLPLAVALAVGSPRRWMRLVGGSSGVLLALAILLSASRGAWLALALCLPLWWATRSRRNLVVSTACAVVLLLGLAGYLMLVPGASLQQAPIVNQTLVPLFARPDRVDVYRGSWYLIQDFPFTGIGLGGTFAMVYSRYVLLIQVPFLTYSHNLFLQVWLNHGVLGILAFTWLIAAFCALVWRVGRRGDALFQGAWLGVAAILLHGLSDARQYADGWTFFPFFVLLGLAVASWRVSESANQRVSESAHRRGGRWVWMVGVITLGVMGLLAWQPLAAMAYANAGALLQARAQLTEGLSDEQRSDLIQQAVSDYQRAVSLDADNRTAQQRLGMLALDARRLDEAVTHLEAAYNADPTNATTHKALGLAYTWAGRFDEAGQLLADVPEIVEELNVWGWWWGTQGESEWAANAYRVSLLLEPGQPGVRDRLSALESE
ncbi:MAG: O-antigen ligase family protein [Anaerolineae bacterium]|nr:O-antigen ligase family protein [Anaerolineae bacterium]